MNDFISRDEAIERLKYAKTARAECKYPVPPLTEERVIRFLKALPAVEPKTGHWIIDGCIEMCDQCGEPKEFPHWKYCPNCGAKMERSLCDSCVTKGCIFQAGIVRSHCDFYKAESEE